MAILRCEAAFTHVLHVDLGALGVLVPQRVLLGTSQRLDQAVTDDARLGAVRVVAEIAVQRVVGVLHELVDLGQAAPLGTWIGVAHIGPVQDVVGRFAGHAHRVGRRGGAGLESLVRLAREFVDQHVPDLEVAAHAGQTGAAFLVLEAAAEGAIHDDLVVQGKGVRTRFIVFPREAVRHQDLVHRAKGRDRLFLVGRLLRIDGVHGAELVLVAGAAVGRVHIGRRPALALGAVRVQAAVARIAAHGLVGRIHVEALDGFVAFVAIAGVIRLGLHGLGRHRRLGRRLGLGLGVCGDRTQRQGQAGAQPSESGEPA
jgi:hypothetical protein